MKLILVGPGDIEAGKALVKKELLNRVEFRGFISRSELIQEIDSCKFAVIPSFFETFGMVAIEIMARGKALIYTNRTSGPEIIEHGVDGLLVDPEDIINIEFNMRKLINNRELRESMGAKAGVKIKRNYSSEIISKELNFFYKSS